MFCRYVYGLVLYKISRLMLYYTSPSYRTLKIPHGHNIVFCYERYPEKSRIFYENLLPYNLSGPCVK